MKKEKSKYSNSIELIIDVAIVIFLVTILIIQTTVLAYIKELNMGLVKNSEQVVRMTEGAIDYFNSYKEQTKNE